MKKIKEVQKNVELLEEEHSGLVNLKKKLLMINFKEKVPEKNSREYNELKQQRLNYQ